MRNGPETHPAPQHQHAVNEVTLQKIDYEEDAREAGEQAYQDALADGLPEPVAKRFKEVFGAPIEPEFRFS